MKTLFIQNQNNVKLLKKQNLINQSRSQQSLYNGEQLRPLWIYENHKILGPALVAWCGPCDVTLDHMVDYEDKIVNARICGDMMLHFIMETFPANLQSGVFMQRLLASIVKDEIEKELRQNNLKQSVLIWRKGDDLYVQTPSLKLSWRSSKAQTKKFGQPQGAEPRKLSISIATVSAVSTLIHFALNITNQGTPVPTASLHDLKINPEKLAQSVMQVFKNEFESVIEATQKVKPV